MALDSRAKRASAIHVASPWRAILPAPDGAIEVADRQQLAYLYGGIPAGAPPEPPVGLGSIITATTRSMQPRNSTVEIEVHP